MIIGIRKDVVRRLACNLLQARLASLAGLSLFAVLLLLADRTAHAGQCFTDGPRYQLESDTVEWRMRVRSSERCVRGVRFSYVWNAEVSLVSPPKNGEVSVMGPGFSYTAKPDFHGEDSFVVSVSGSKQKTKGSSTIRVTVTVGGANEAIAPSHTQFAHFDPNLGQP